MVTRHTSQIGFQNHQLNCAHVSCWPATNFLQTLISSPIGFHSLLTYNGHKKEQCQRDCKNLTRTPNSSTVSLFR